MISSLVYFEILLKSQIIKVFKIIRNKVSKNCNFVSKNGVYIFTDAR